MLLKGGRLMLVISSRFIVVGFLTFRLQTLTVY